VRDRRDEVALSERGQSRTAGGPAIYRSAIANLGGKHIQARTGRELTYQCIYEVVGNVELFYGAVINEGRDYLGQHEATLRCDPSGVPAKSVVRLNLLKHIDRTAFGEGQPPNPQWIGWYGL
jgi:hypothetical protein